MIALALQEPGYRSGRYERWARGPVAGTRFGNGWKLLAAERARLGRPLCIAQANTHNLPYPLYGSDLRNLVRSLPASGREADLYYRFGARQLAPFAGATPAGWRRFVSEFRPDYFFSSVRLVEKTFGPEDRWAATSRDLLRLVYADPEVRIYAAAAADEVAALSSLAPRRDQQQLRECPGW